MPWPQTVDYNSAIQNPRECFRDPDLARGQAVEGMMPGIPLSFAGSFATVYKVQSGNSTWAVKCFTRKVEGLQPRYKEVSSHLERIKRRFAVNFQYLQEGIKVSGVWYPVVKMQWVEGSTLNEFLRDRVGNPGLLEQLAHLWLRLGSEMRESRLAHGDLQHGNVILVPGSSSSSLLLRLVDYDGMWVPTLADRDPGEVGHPNYQHPQRLAEGGYSADVDRFSLLAIYTALRCLEVGGKSLWAAHDNEENILFRESDFKNPAQSRLFPKLLTLPDPACVLLTGHLLVASQGPLDQVPLVNDLTPEAGVRPLSVEQITRLRELVPSAPFGQRAAVPVSAPPADTSAPALPEMPKRSSLRPSAPEIEFLPEVAPVAPAPAFPAPLAGTAVLEALAADPLPGSGRLMTPAINHPALPPPPTAKKAEKTHSALPPLPSRKSSAAPDWLMRLGLRENSPIIRHWPLLLALVVGLPLLLAAAGAGVYALWPHESAPPIEKPRLLPVAPVTLRAGHESGVVVSVVRSDFDDVLTVRLERLPDDVTCPAEGQLPGGDESGEVRLRLRAAPTASRSGKILVRLYLDEEKLDEQEVELTVLPFVAPRLVKKDLELQLLPGGSVSVVLDVIDNGNTDTRSLRAEPLPPGVSQRPLRTPLAPRQVGLELVAASDAPDSVEIIKLSLYADGIFAGFLPATLSVEKPKTPMRIGLEWPNNIRLPLGGKKSFEVQLTRGGYKGPIKLTVEGLPRGVTAAPVEVAEGADSADVELKSAEDVKASFELQEFRLSAHVNGKEVGSHSGTFTLVRPRVEVKTDPTKEKPEEVSFSTADGATLRATLYPSPKGKDGPTVLMVCEPSKSFSRKDENWVRLARALQKLGCSVLTFDFRGFGENARGFDSLPVSFWSFQVNKELFDLLGKKKILDASRGFPTTLNGDTFPPKYIPWLVQDIVAARFYLDLMHDKGALNSKNLIVIGAGEGVTLASIWYASECRRQKWSAARAFDTTPQPPFENRDVIAAVWLDNTSTLGKLTIAGRPINALAVVKATVGTEKTQPKMLFVFDKLAAGAAARNRAMSAVLHQSPRSEKPLAAGGLTGQALLGNAVVEKALLQFVEGVLDREPRPWEARGLRESNYTWFLGGTKYSASFATEKAPRALPLETLGFTYLAPK